jgi:hypothetical protein
VKDENGDLLTESHNILNRWNNYFSQLLNVYRASDVRHIDTVEQLVPDPSPFEVEIAIAKLKRFKLPGNYQILAELIQAGGEILFSKSHELINSIWNMEKFPFLWESIIVPVPKKGDKTDLITYLLMDLSPS